MTADVVTPFLLTVAVSFLVGIGLRDYYEAEGKRETFGTVRTFVFIGMLGFILFRLPGIGGSAFLLGFASLSIFLLVYYWNKVLRKRGPGMIGVLMALLAYTAGPVALSSPPWYLVLIAVSVLFVLHAKGRIRRLTDRLETGEVVTACKFLAIAAVALPLIPAEVPAGEGWLQRVFLLLPVTPRQMWLAVVITTAISYLGYVLQTYLFPRKGLLLTGVVGGLYSSTMTVIVVSKKSKDAPAVAGQAATAILFAVSMMYLRLLALVAIFRITAAVIVGPALVALASLAAGYGVWLRGRRARTSTTERAAAAGADETAVGAAFRRNPLELNAALLFAVLFAVVSVATKYVLESFADLGLRVLSFLVGFSDITPFVVSLLQGDFGIGDAQIAQAIVIASASNNVLKMGYAYAVGSRRTAALAAPGVAALVLLSFTYAFAFM